MLVAGDLFEQVHVALVRGADVERDAAEQGVAGLLEHDGLADVRQAEAAIFDADMRGEQAGVGGEPVQLAFQLVAGAVGALAGVVLERDHLVTDEIARPDLQILQFRREREVHFRFFQKARPSASSWVNSAMPVPIAVSPA